ncbi:hypothetical protein VPH35_111119 [Triticum aestivum]
MGNGKGKAKELSPQDAVLLIQMNYRAHLAHRSQVLSSLRDLAVAKAKLKELQSLFYNLSYRRRLSHDHEERQRFSEKIIVLLLTVDALESMCEKNGQTPPPMPVIAPAGTRNSRQASTGPSPSATGATGSTPTPTPS